MKKPPQILIVDDQPFNVDILKSRLASQGYQILTAMDGEQALQAARAELPDLILLDIMMPKIDGIEVCRRLKNDDSLPFMPIIMVTAKAESKDIVSGLEAGADEYLSKPVDQTALVARVKSMLRIKALHDKNQAQAAELAGWNRTLEQRVAEQLVELERTSRLKRFLAPAVADIIVSSGPEQLERIMASHSREITAVFCDLRGFTAFAENAEPEEVIRVLREFHDAIGPLIAQFEATLEQIAGDGIMVYFNDPLPCPDPAPRAVRMAVAMREKVRETAQTWRSRSHRLGVGFGIAMGHATLGEIGFADHYHYGAIGPALNLASRLCDQADDGQILVSQQVRDETAAIAVAAPVGELHLKGFANPMPAFNVESLK